MSVQESKRFQNEHRPHLAFFREHVAAMVRELELRNEEELTALDKAVHAATNTNCGWDEYRAALILRPLILEERGRRKMVAKARAEAVA